MKIINVASARPNFMKIAPLLKEFKKRGDDIDAKLLHTGQHYDYEMSKIFFDELGIPKPDFHLGIGSGTHAEQSGKVMIEFEKVLQKEQPDWVIVVGDVNPTMACTVTANKLGIKTAHVEAGLRSYDRSMPEEVNRVLTDQIADLLLTPSIDGNMNLIKEGVDESKIHFVGNIMIDTLYNMRDESVESPILKDIGIESDGYMLVTLHRPSNVDEKEKLSGYIDIIEQTGRQLPVVWPVHPRSKKRALEFGFWKKMKEIKHFHLLEPVGYKDNVALMNNARLVLTDSGGIQEETTVLGIPCLTARENTERPVTITDGTNTLAGTDKNQILKLIEQRLNGEAAKNDHRKPLYWDGKTAERIVDAILERD